MKYYKLLTILLTIILLSSFVYATTNDANQYFSFDDADLTGSNPDDISGNGNDGTNNGASTGSTGILNQAFDYNGGSKYVNTNYNEGTVYTFSFWAYIPTYSSSATMIGVRDASGNNREFYVGHTASNTILSGWYTSSNGAAGEVTGTVTENAWNFITITRNGNSVELFVNGVSQDTDSTSGKNNPTTNWVLGRNGDQAIQYFMGLIDEYSVYDRVLSQPEIDELYNSGSGFNPYSGTPTPTNFTTRVEQTVVSKQPNVISLSSTSYQNILSGNFTLQNKTNVSVVTTLNVNMINSLSSQIDCQILIDGTNYNATKSRTVSQNSWGSMYITSSVFELSSGEHTQALQCKRNALPIKTFQVTNVTQVINILSDASGDPLKYSVDAINSTINSTTYQLLDTFQFETSNINISDNTKKSIVINGGMQYNYASTGTITIYAEINGTNSSEYPRYGTAGSVGSMGGLYFVAPTPQTNESQNITINLYGKSTSASGSISGNFIAKEIVTYYNETNTTALSGTYSSTSWQNVAQLQITDFGSDSARFIAKAGIPHTANQSTRTQFRLLANGVGSLPISRTISASNQNGITIVQDVFNVTDGVTTVYLQTRNSNGATTTINGGDLTAYVTDAITFSETSFQVTAYNYSSNLSINTFNVTLEDTGAVFSTTTGSVTVTPNSATENITIRSAGFLNNNQVHDVTTNLNATMRPFRNVITFLNLNNSDPISSATITVIYPDDYMVNLTTNSTGQISFDTIRSGTTYFGEYGFIFNLKSGFVSPQTFYRNITYNVSPYTNTFSIDTVGFNVSVYDVETLELINDSIVTIVGAGSFNITGGNKIIKDVSFGSGNYTAYALKTGYEVSQVNFDYNGFELENLDFYLIKSNSTNLGTLVVNVFDEYYNEQQNVDIRLLSYISSQDSFVEIDQCFSNSNGECFFDVELGVKLYKVTGTRIISDSNVQFAQSSDNGEFIFFDNYEIDLHLYETSLYQVDSLYGFILNVLNESLVITGDNQTVSYLTGYFYGTTSINNVCIEYKYINNSRYYPLSGGLNCLNNASGYINVFGGYNLTSVLQTNDVSVEIYVNNSGEIKSYYFAIYPAEDSFESTTGDLASYIIMLVFLLSLSASIYLKNINIFVFLSIFSSIMGVLLLPSYITWQFASIIIVMCLFVVYLARKQEANIGV